MVGAMLLVGLTVLGVAIVAAIFLSGAQPDEIPHAVIVAGVDETGRLALAHEGGDPLGAGEYRIYVDAGGGLVDETGSFSKPEGGVWSIGGSLVYNGPPPERVVVTAVAGGIETILAEPEFTGRGAGFSPDPVEPGTVPNGGGGGSEEKPVVIVIPEIGNPMEFTKSGGRYSSLVSAQVTDDGVSRVDFTMYDVADSTNYAVDHRKNAPGGPGNGTYEAWFEVSESQIKDVNSVVVVAIAFNETDSVVDCDARTVRIGLT